MFHSDPLGFTSLDSVRGLDKGMVRLFFNDIDGGLIDVNRKLFGASVKSSRV